MPRLCHPMSRPSRERIMTVVTSITEIEENLQLFEDYLCEGTDEEQLFCSELIRKGSCFIAYETENELRFSPSRYRL
jgi:hypothetical protein